MILIIGIVLIEKINYPKSMKLINQEKQLALKDKLEKDLINLIFLTVTGDKSFSSKYLNQTYKELQIIHLLVISGSNISVFLMFTYIFIGRKNMKGYLLRQMIVILYAKFIGFPEPFIRAITSTFITDLISSKGIKASIVRELFFVVLVSYIVYILSKSGTSFVLSLIFSVAITIFNRVVKNSSRPKFINFMLFSLYMTGVTFIVSLWFFEVNICQSLISNVLITPFYDVVTVTSYIVYFIPNPFWNYDPLSKYVYLLLNFAYYEYQRLLMVVGRLGANVCG